MLEAYRSDDSCHTFDDLLMTFSKVQVSNINDLDSTLEKLCYSLVNTYDVDRCGVWIFDPSDTILTCKSLYSRLSGSFSSNQQIIISAFPEYFEAIKHHRVLSINNAQENPLTKNFYQEYLEKIEINSIINLGLWDNGQMIGVLSFADRRNNSELSRLHNLSLIPFADLCSRWVCQTFSSLELKKKSAFNNEILLREVSALCRKSEYLSLNTLIKKTLSSFSNLIKNINISALILNQEHATHYPINPYNPEDSLDYFQSQNLHKIALHSKYLWIPNTNKLAIGLPSILKKILSEENTSAVIIASDHQNKNSSMNFILAVEFSKPSNKLEEHTVFALDQLRTAFSIILEHAETRSILRESLAFAKGAFDGSNIGMAVFNKSGEIIRINRSLSNLVEGQHQLINNIIPKTLLNTDSNLDDITSKGNRRIELPSGEYLQVYTDISNIESTNTVQSYFLLQVLDITTQYKAINDLKEQKKLFKSVIDLNPAFIFAKSLDGTFVLANESVSKVYGTTPEGMIGKKDSDYNYDSLEVKKFREDDTRVILGKKEINIPEEKITDSSGNVRYLQTVKKPILNPHDGRYLVLGVSTDITERKVTEEREKKWLEEVANTKRLESLALLASGIAHDFNNLLQIIMGNCTLSMRDLDRKSDTFSYIEKVLIAGEKASSLCNQLLCYSKSKPIQRGLININELVQECTFIFKGPISKDVEIIYSIDPNLPLILGDKTQIEQVIMNLVSNAIEAASEGGKQITISTKFNEELAQLEVQDNGKGIPEEIKQQIFEPFFTTKPNGRGLGLSAVLGIIENHGGLLEVQSTCPNGSKFSVRLPTSTPKKNMVNTDYHHINSQGNIKGKTFILIGDESLSRDVSKEMLTIAGATVLISDNTLPILSRLKDKSLNIDAAILDLSTPVTSAEEAIIKIRSMRPETPILVISGYTNQINKIEVLNQTNISFLAKPYSFNQLISALSID